MKITKFQQDPIRVTYELKHITDNSTLIKSMTLTNRNGKWVAEIPLDNFPECETPDEAATKLGEWMYRLSTVIMAEDNQFSKLDLTKISLE